LPLARASTDAPGSPPSDSPRRALRSSISSTGRTRYVQVEPVGDGARQAGPIALGRRRATRAHAPTRAEPAARARVDEATSRNEAGSYDQAPADAPDADEAVLERLPQRLDRGALELGQLVEEQHAVVGQRDLARARRGAAAEQGGHADGVVRRAERPLQRQAVAEPGRRR
jgi:hypothetical protein